MLQTLTCFSLMEILGGKEDHYLLQRTKARKESQARGFLAWKRSTQDWGHLSVAPESSVFPSRCSSVNPPETWVQFLEVEMRLCLKDAHEIFFLFTREGGAIKHTDCL